MGRSSLEELRRRCLKPNYDTRSWNIWYARAVTHQLSVRLVGRLAKTPITPNHVTLIATTLGVLAALIFSGGSPIALLIGACVLELYYVFDAVDGQLARLRGQASLTGAYFDWVTNYLVHPAVFLGLGWGQFVAYGDEIDLLAGAVAAVGIVSVSLVTLCEERLRLQVAASSRRRDDAEVEEPGTGDPLKQAFVLLHGLCTYPPIMNAITLTALIGLMWPWWGDLAPMEWLVRVYSVALVVVWLVKVGHVVGSRALDDGKA